MLLSCSVHGLFTGFSLPNETAAIAFAVPLPGAESEREWMFVVGMKVNIQRSPCSLTRHCVYRVQDFLTFVIQNAFLDKLHKVAQKSRTHTTALLFDSVFSQITRQVSISALPFDR